MAGVDTDWADRIEFKVETSGSLWDSSPPYTWHNVTCDLIRVRSERGKDQWSVGDYPVGRLSLEFDNRDGDYTQLDRFPPNQSVLAIGNQIRLSGRVPAGTWTPVFSGYIASIPQLIYRGGADIVSVTVVDYMAGLNRYGASPGTSQPENAATRLNHLLDHCPFPKSMRKLDHHGFLVASGPPDSIKIGEQMRLVARSVGGALYMDAAGNVVFHVLGWLATKPANLDIINASDAPLIPPPGAQIVCAGGDRIVFEHSDDRVINWVKLEGASGVSSRQYDAPSMKVYGRREYLSSGLLTQSAQALKAIAESILNQAKQARPRVRQVTVPIVDVDTARWALSVKIGRTVEVFYMDETGAYAQIVSHIHGIQWNMSKTDVSVTFLTDDFAYARSQPPTHPPVFAPTGVTPGTPGVFTPQSATTPTDLTFLKTLGTLGQTGPWAKGQWVNLGDGTKAHWTGTQWVVGDGMSHPTGVTVGKPGAFTPTGCDIPTNLAALRGYGSLGQTTIWDEGEHVILGDGSDAYWTGTAWASGTAPRVPHPPTGATSGTPGSFTPAGCDIPANLAALKTLGPLGQAARWPAGSYVVVSDGSKTYWSGTAWVSGVAPAVPLPPTGVTPGMPGTFTPARSETPADLTALTGLGPLGQAAAWTPGEYVRLGDGMDAYWDGSVWKTGRAPQIVIPCTGVTAGKPGSFTPTGCEIPHAFADLTALGDLGNTSKAWTVGQFVTIGDGSKAYWDGKDWGHGAAPDVWAGPPMGDMHGSTVTRVIVPVHNRYHPDEILFTLTPGGSVTKTKDNQVCVVYDEHRTPTAYTLTYNIGFDPVKMTVELADKAHDVHGKEFWIGFRFKVNGQYQPWAFQKISKSGLPV